MAEMNSRLSKHQIRKSMTCAIVASMAALVGMSCLDSSVLTLLAIKLGGQELFIGWINFVPPAALVFSLLTINAMEKFGKKKVLITGYTFAIFFIAPLFLLPYIDGHFHIYAGLALLFTVTALRAVTNSMGSVGWLPIFQDFVPPKITGKFFANLRIFWQSAWLVSLLGIAYFLRKDDPQWWRFQIIFGIGVIAYIVRVFSILPMSQKHSKTQKTKPVAIRHRFKNTFAHQSIRIFLLYLFFYLVASTMAEPFKIKLLKDFGYGYGFILAANASVCLGAIISLRFWGKIADKFGNRSVFSISHIGMITVSLLWILVEPSSFGSVLVFVLYFTSSIFNSANGIAYTRYILHSVPSDKQYILSVFQVVAGCAMAMGPLLGGIFLANTKVLSLHFGAVTLNNYSLLFIFTACLFVIPHMLRKKLRMKKETSTWEVLAVVARPLRNIIGPFLSIKGNNNK